MDVNDMLSDLKVEQAEGHAPGCDGKCMDGVEESMDTLTAALAMASMGAPVAAAMILTTDPVAALYVLSGGDASKVPDLLRRFAF